MSQQNISATKAAGCLENALERGCPNGLILVACGYALLAIAEALQNLAPPKKTEEKV